MIDEEISQSVDCVVIDAVFKGQLAGGGTAGLRIMVAPHRFYQPMTSV